MVIKMSLKALKIADSSIIISNNKDEMIKSNLLEKTFANINKN
jgi:hypothetical protein